MSRDAFWLWAVSAGLLAFVIFVICSQLEKIITLLTLISQK